MVRRTVTLVTGAAIVSSACLVFPGHASAATWSPGVMAALGDSISAGFNACGWYVSCTSRSWSAGDNSTVNSHYLRLRGGSRESGRNLNFAVPGATSADLAGQARQAVRKGVEYVTILIGAQDACVRDEKNMTPVATYRRNIGAALDVLREASPPVRVFVASIPDIKRLWSVGKDSTLARTFWSVGQLCQSMLWKPTSTAKADRARRDRVRARVVDYNAALAQECAAYGPACRFDRNAVFSYPFTLDHVSKWDFFHPNAEGQRIIAERTAFVLRGWDLPAPVPEEAQR